MFTAKLTSKNQITFPKVLIEKLGLKKGEIFSIQEEKGKIILQTNKQILDELAELGKKIPKKLDLKIPD